MLLLKRSPGQSILIGEDVRVDVQAIVGCRVRIRVLAPPTILIHRADLKDRDDLPGLTPDSRPSALVVARRAGQKISFGGITIRVIDVTPDDAGILVDAPDDRTVCPKELREAGPASLGRRGRGPANGASGKGSRWPADSRDDPRDSDHPDEEGRAIAPGRPRGGVTKPCRAAIRLDRPKRRTGRRLGDLAARIGRAFSLLPP